MKSINDVLKAIGLSEGSRDRIIKKIINKYHIVPCSENKKYNFTEKDFKIIIAKEGERKKSESYTLDNFDAKKLDIYYLNKERGLYPRLTEYGGLV